MSVGWGINTPVTGVNAKSPRPSVTLGGDSGVLYPPQPINDQNNLKSLDRSSHSIVSRKMSHHFTSEMWQGRWIWGLLHSVYTEIKGERKRKRELDINNWFTHGQYLLQFLDSIKVIAIP